MQTEEYQKMRDLEDHYWWFVSRRRLALSLLAEYFPDPTLGLDLGSGTGAFLSELQSKFRCLGMDFSPHALAFSKERGLVDLIQGDAERIPLHSDSIDLVVSLDTLEHVPNDVAAFDEILRVLKPGGTLILNVPAYRWLWGPHDEALMHYRRYTRKFLRERLTSAGFEVRKTSYSVFFLFPAVVASRIIEKFRRGEAKVRLPQFPPFWNRQLVGLMDFEAKLLKWVGLPYGSSLVAVARKPEAKLHP